MAFIWVVFLLTVVLTVVYVWLNDEKLNGLPSELSTLSPNRWSPKLIRDTLQKVKDEESPFRKENLPPKTGRRYIVVGGAGFLGRYILTHLLERGEDPHLIRVLDLQPPRDIDPRVGFVKVDITDAKAVDSAFQKPWPTVLAAHEHAQAQAEEELKPEITVFHTAAVIRFWERHASLRRLSERINVEGTKHVLEAAKNAGASVLVYTSSTAVGTLPSWFFLSPFSKAPPNFVQVFNDDTQLPTDETQTSNYSLSKIKAERMVLKADRTPSASGKGVLRTGALRPGGIIYGPGDRMLVARLIGNDTNYTFGPNIMQSSICVENCSLAHLLYEQRLIELESQTRRGEDSNTSNKNPDIGGQAFCITDPGQAPTMLDHHTAGTIATGGKMKTVVISPTIACALAYLVEWYHLAHIALNKSTMFGFLGRLVPPPSGDIVVVQPATLATACTHLVVDDSRARKAVEKGGLGYVGLCDSVEGVCRSMVVELGQRGRR